jgi:putative phage-type endonuclease
MEKNMLTDEQRLRRREGIGASDTAIIMGYSSYKTPYQLYLEKTGIVTNEEPETTEQQYWGNAIEPLIIKRFSEENSLDITFPDTIYHAVYPFIFANLDGWVESERAVVEAKCANSFQRREWDPNISDGIPIAYLIQIAKQVMVADATRGYCAVLIGGFEYGQFIYERDKSLEELILKADLDFWNCVQNKIEPDPINTNDCRLKYRKPIADKIAQATYKIANTFGEFTHIKQQIKSLEKIEDNLKMQLMTFMGDSEYLIEHSGEVIATWKANKKGTRVFNIK